MTQKRNSHPLTLWSQRQSWHLTRSSSSGAVSDRVWQSGTVKRRVISTFKNNPGKKEQNFSIKSLVFEKIEFNLFISADEMSPNAMFIWRFVTEISRVSALRYLQLSFYVKEKFFTIYLLKKTGNYLPCSIHPDILNFATTFFQIFNRDYFNQQSINTGLTLPTFLRYYRIDIFRVNTKINNNKIIQLFSTAIITERITPNFQK